MACLCGHTRPLRLLCSALPCACQPAACLALPVRIPSCCLPACLPACLAVHAFPCVVPPSPAAGATRLQTLYQTWQRRALRVRRPTCCSAECSAAASASSAARACLPTPAPLLLSGAVEIGPCFPQASNSTGLPAPPAAAAGSCRRRRARCACCATWRWMSRRKTTAATGAAPGLPCPPQTHHLTKPDA